MSILKSFLCPYKSTAPGFLLLVVELCWRRKVREVWDQLSWSWVSFLHRSIVWEHQNRNRVGRWASGALKPGSKLDPPSKNAWTKSWLHLGSGLNGSWDLIADWVHGSEPFVVTVLILSHCKYLLLPLEKLSFAFKKKGLLFSPLQASKMNTKKLCNF